MTTSDELPDNSEPFHQLPDRQGEILDAWCLYLERGGQELPDEFLRKHTVASVLNASQLKELRQSLQSVRLVHAAGQKLQSVASTVSDVEAGTQLGDFQILRPIGRGGMGVVFLARQISLNREVALKILPNNLSCTESARARFQLEARASAALSHASIVPVYAIGSESGVDYFAMQYVPGVTLQQWIRGNSGVAADTSITSELHAGSMVSGIEATSGHRGPRNDREKMAHVVHWMVQIADALEHAHRSGIVHRDVKPSNILIGEDFKPWLMDFGLAHIEQDVSLTATGTVIGSLRYMSPEQFRPGHGFVDHRTDIYGLGVTLFEALTGRPAVPGDDRNEIVSRLCTGADAPDWPGTANVPTDLRTIVIRAIQPDPADRYRSAAELAADLTAFLEDRPILAHPVRWSDRLTRWSKRHKRIVMGMFSGLLLATTGLGISVWLISEARHRADQSAVIANAAQERAEQNLNEALTAITTFYRTTSKSLEEVPGTQKLSEQLMRDAQAFFERLAESNIQSAVPLENQAEAEVMLAGLYAQFGRPDDALQVAEKSLVTIQRLRQLRPGAGVNLEAHAQFAMATAHLALGDDEDALSAADRCLALVEQIQEKQSAHVWQHHIYRWKRGEILLHLQRYADALTQMQQAVDEARQSLQSDPENYRAGIDLAHALMDLGDTQQRTSNLQDAENSYLAGMAEIDRLENEPLVSFSRRYFGRQLCSRLGRICVDRSDWTSAQPWLVRARDLADALYQEHSENVEALHALLQAEAWLGRCLLKNGEREPALVHLRRSSELTARFIASGDPAVPSLDLSSAIDALAITEMQIGQTDAAIGHFRQAIEISTAAHRRDPKLLDAIVFLTNHHYNLHSVLKMKQDLPAAAEAITGAEKWQTLFLREVPDHMDERLRLAQILTQESSLLTKLERWTEAAETAGRGLTNIGSVLQETRLAAQGDTHRDWYLAVLTECAWHAGTLEDFRRHAGARLDGAAALAGDLLTRRRNTILRDLNSLPKKEDTADLAAEWNQVLMAIVAEVETRLPKEDAAAKDVK